MNLIDQLKVDHLPPGDRFVSLYNAAQPYDRDSPVNYLIVRDESDEYKALLELTTLDRERDFGPELPCWISRPIHNAADLGFERAVVFDHEDGTTAPKWAWAPFQAMGAFNGVAHPFTATLAVPTRAGEDFLVMLRMCFFAAAALSARLNCPEIRIVVPDRHLTDAASVFGLAKTGYEAPPSGPEEDGPAFVRNTCNVAPIDFGLTERQYEAIYQYSQSSYFYINRVLRADQVAGSDYAYFQPSIEAISTGLNQLRNYLSEQRVNRSVADFPGIWDLYQEGMIARELAYTSTTKRTRPPSSNDLRIRSTLGKDISAISFFPDEEEVLFDHDLRHLVFSIIERQSPGLYRDIDSDESLSNSFSRKSSHL